MPSFFDPAATSSYAEMAERNVPGLRDLHRMVSLLLEENIAPNGKVLVVGAGGGLELSALVGMNLGWQFVGVDPSAPMLAQARTLTQDFADRISFHQGYIENAPEGQFDGATCLLTLHFLNEAERMDTLRGIYRRLRPGAPLVIVHHSFPNDDVGKARWLSRFAKYVATPQGRDTGPEINVEAMKDRLPVLSPEQDEAILFEAGFRRIELFYAALTFKGWVAYRD